MTTSWADVLNNTAAKQYCRPEPKTGTDSTLNSKSAGWTVQEVTPRLQYDGCNCSFWVVWAIETFVKAVAKQQPFLDMFHHRIKSEAMYSGQKGYAMRAKWHTTLNTHNERVHDTHPTPTETLFSNEHAMPINTWQKCKRPRLSSPSEALGTEAGPTAHNNRP